MITSNLNNKTIFGFQKNMKTRRKEKNERKKKFKVNKIFLYTFSNSFYSFSLII